MGKIRWSEKKIEEHVSNGWSLSYDKTNDKFKLQKRMDGKVNSYSLPKQFNEFCWKLKEELKLTKGKPLKEVFKAMEDEKFPLFNFTCVNTFNMDWDTLEKVVEKYCEEKVKELTPKEVVRMALYSYLILKKSGGVGTCEPLLFGGWAMERIDELEKRIDDITYGLKQVLGNTEIGFTCPKCGKWTHLELRRVEGRKKWVCAKCGEDPFWI